MRSRAAAGAGRTPCRASRRSQRRRTRAGSAWRGSAGRGREGTRKGRSWRRTLCERALSDEDLQQVIEVVGPHAPIRTRRYGLRRLDEARAQQHAFAAAEQHPVARGPAVLFLLVDVGVLELVALGD